MSRAAIENAKRITPALFGDTDIAGGIPHELRPLPSDGPVYFEGQLVLVLSFQGGEDAARDDDDAARDDDGAANGEDSPATMKALPTVAQASRTAKASPAMAMKE